MNLDVQKKSFSVPVLNWLQGAFRGARAHANAAEVVANTASGGHSGANSWLKKQHSGLSAAARHGPGSGVSGPKDPAHAVVSPGFTVSFVAGIAGGDLSVPCAQNTQNTQGTQQMSRPSLLSPLGSQPVSPSFGKIPKPGNPELAAKMLSGSPEKTSSWRQKLAAFAQGAAVPPAQVPPQPVALPPMPKDQKFINFLNCSEWEGTAR